MARAKLLWFEYDESDQVARLLRMPPVIHMVNANKKQSFEKIVGVLGFGVEAWNLPLHDFTASVLP
jgi:hypothetical protein